MISGEQVLDIWHTLEFSEKLKDFKSQNICLDLVNNLCHVSILKESMVPIDVLERILDQSEYMQLT